MPFTFRGKPISMSGFKRMVDWSLKDLSHTAAFRLNVARRRRQEAAFSACRTHDAYYRFALETIGLMQHQSEIVGLLEHVAAIQPRNVCEIGTYEGGTNLLIGQSIPTVRRVIGLDLFVQHTAQLRHFCHPDRTVHYLNGSSQSPASFEKVKRLLQGEMLDFLFIDGDHRYDGVKRDFLLHRHLVRDGGLIAFHDIVPDHRTRFGKDTGMWAGDVPLFWSRIKRAYPHREFIQDPEQDGLGIGVLTYCSSIELPAEL